MLIDNKFIYLSLPRCGSTSFHYSCILAGLNIQSLDSRVDFENLKIDFNSIDESKIMNSIEHGHTPLVDLQKKFGYGLPVVAVTRDKYDTFYSLYKHVIFDLSRVGLVDLSYKFSNFTLDELFFFKTMDITSKKNRYKIINEYLLKLMPDLQYHEFGKYAINIVDILITPNPYWHNHNKNIIWFDITQMEKFEKWVSNITNVNFRLKHVNSSSFIQTNLKLDDAFIEKYDSVYEYYDSPKSEKSIL